MIRAIATKRYGISRNELLKQLAMTTGGTFTKRINELEASGFIQVYVPYQHRKKDHYYRVVDEYTMFYLQWIEPAFKKNLTLIPNYWQKESQSSRWLSAAGYGFETICLKHIDKIYHKLGLDNIHSIVSNWRYIPKKGAKDEGAQIDLLFDREDGVISLCEIKYAKEKITINKALAKQLANKVSIFEKITQTNKQIFVTMITTNGIKETIWSDELIDSEVTLEAFFS